MRAITEILAEVFGVYTKKIKIPNLVDNKKSVSLLVLFNLAELRKKFFVKVI